MSRSVTFNGITRYRPGGITKINAEALNQVSSSTGQVIGLIGEADGGEPGSTAGLVSVRDPSRAVEMFRSGPLVDAIKLAFQSSGDPLIPGGAAEVVIYKTNASTQSTVQMPSLTTTLVATVAVAAGSTTATINTTAAAFTASALIGRWVTIEVTSTGLTYLRRITGNGTASVTVTPALPAVPANGDDVIVHATNMLLSSRDYGLHTASIDATLDYTSATDTTQVVTNFEGVEQLSPALGGVTRNYLHVLYRGGPAATTTRSVTASSVSTITVDGAAVTGLYALNTLVLRDVSGNLKAVTKITSCAGQIITLATNLLTAATVGDTVEILAVTAALGGFTGASGLSTAFVSTITGVTGDNLSITLPQGMTLRQLANAINANTNYVATIPSQINGDTELAQQFDFTAAGTTSMQTSYTGTVATTGFRQNLQEVITWINAEATNLTATRFTTAALDGGSLNVVDYPGSTGDQLPFAFVLTGGVRGISTNTTFQDAFDEMLLQVVDEVVPLIDEDLTNEGNSSTATWAAVSAQLVDHVSSARGAAGLERGGWIGFQGTKTEYIAACNSVNDMDIACVSQNPTVVGATGDLVEKGPREFAVMGASMRCGVNEIGEPLTNKFLRVSGLTQDSSWDPASVTDSGDLIQNGAMFAETVPGQGTKWVRDLTTWVKDDNLAYSEGSVRDVVRHVAYNLRTGIDRRFTGRKATPATVAAIRDFAVSLLEVYRTDNIIVDSTDPATGAKIKAYHNIKVYSSGDVVSMNVGIFPVPGINFELTSIFLSLPTQSA